jgi:hypothetical protein
VLLFTTLEAFDRLELWRFTPFAFLARVFSPDLALLDNGAKEGAKPPQTKEQAQEMPAIFVDVDASQASPDAPDESKYYAVVDTRAGNPDTSRDTKTPAIDGTQDKVPKTADSPRPSPQPQPLQPAPAEPAPKEPEPEPPLPAEPPSVTQPPANQQRPAEAAPTEPSRIEAPGDLAMAKPSVTPEARPTRPADSSPAAPPRRDRPRTLVEARARQAAGSSALEGAKMRQDGGVKRFSIQPSVDARATPFAVYDARFIAAVQQCWMALLENQRYSLDRLGKVVLDFHLTQDGRITDMKLVESDVGDIYTTICQLAITKPAPYEKWPLEMRRMIGANHRQIRFTFYY